MNRNMDNLDNLSDDELRYRLLHYGLPNIPVTSSTRQLLVKRLRNHMDNEKKKVRRETTQLTKYSSGEEESDRDDPKSNSRRTTMRNNVPEYSGGGGLGGRSTRSTIGRSGFVFQKPASPPRRTVNNNNVGRKEETTPPSPPLLSKLSTTTRRSNQYISPMITSETEEDESDYGSSPSNSPTIRSRFSTTHSNGTHSNDDTPYLSEFTQRLLKLRENRQPSSTTTTFSSANNSHTMPTYRRVFNDREIVHHAYPSPAASPRYNTTTINNSAPHTKFSIRNLYVKVSNNFQTMKQSIVPCSLVTGLIIFFVVVIFMYLTISPDILSSLNKADTNYALCSQNTDLRCIQSEAQLETALELMKLIVPELQRRAIGRWCKDPEKSTSMTSNEIVNLVMERSPHEHIQKILSDVKNAAYLIEMNPHWRIGAVDATGNAIISPESISSSSLSFSIVNPTLPFTCTLRNKLHKFFIVIGLLTITVLIAYVGRTVVTYYINWKRVRQDRFNKLVSDIIQATVEMSQTSNQAIVLNHLRDKLINPGCRNELSKYWNDAIHFLELNESRVQFDIVTINGEDCKTIKWIDSISRMSPGRVVTNTAGSLNSSANSPSTPNTGKKWQSPAFDKTNKIPDPPTQCLKIRQMFDKFEANDPNLKTIIQDSILEKVGNECKIYDIQLDTNTCCVYVRCATNRDAGLVHDEINGWWFDNRLVSIKFVWLKRYLNRFPYSSSGPACLQPSNTKNLSMNNFNNNNNVNGADDDDDDEDGDYEENQY